jgi:hypothetical protein
MYRGLLGKGITDAHIGHTRVLSTAQARSSKKATLEKHNTRRMEQTTAQEEIS